MTSGTPARVGLLPCPCCGATADGGVVHEYRKTGEYGGSHAVVCDYSLGGCGLEGGCMSDGTHVAKWNRRSLVHRVEQLEAALASMVNRYVYLVESGDCGNWDAEKEPEVIAARALLSGVSP